MQFREYIDTRFFNAKLEFFETILNRLWYCYEENGNFYFRIRKCLSWKICVLDSKLRAVRAILYPVYLMNREVFKSFFKKKKRNRTIDNRLERVSSAERIYLRHWTTPYRRDKEHSVWKSWWNGSIVLESKRLSFFESGSTFHVVLAKLFFARIIQKISNGKIQRRKDNE